MRNVGVIRTVSRRCRWTPRPGCARRRSTPGTSPPVVPGRVQLDDKAPIEWEIAIDEKILEPDSDVYALRVERQVSVTPLSLDLTSRVDFAELERHIRSET